MKFLATVSLRAVVLLSIAELLPATAPLPAVALSLAMVYDGAEAATVLLRTVAAHSIIVSHCTVTGHGNVTSHDTSTTHGTVSALAMVVNCGILDRQSALVVNGTVIGLGTITVCGTVGSRD